jgi:hypothetical protein
MYIGRGLFSSVKFKVLESISLSILIFYILYYPMNNIYSVLSIFMPVVALIIYLEYTFSSPWPRIILPLSMASISFLAARMLFNTIPYNVYVWIIVGYAIAVFILYHAVSRILSIYLFERKGRFRIIIEDVLLDIVLFIALSAILVVVLIMFRAVKPYYGLLLVSLETIIFIATPWFINSILENLLRKGSSILGFAHPREPEVERVYMAIASVIVLFSLMIPLLFAYTSPVLIRRAFVPMALLGVYEAIVLALFIAAYILSMHGAVIESYLGDRIQPIEYYRVIRKWRDIAWFLNRGLGYFIRMKYLSALYMLFQGLEILSLRTGDKDLYFGPIYDMLRIGYEELKKHKLASKHVIWSIIDETMQTITPNNIYIVEPDWTPLRGSVYEEMFRRAMSSIVNLYCKLYEKPDIASRESEELIKHAIEKLTILYNKARGDAREYIGGVIEKLRSFLNNGFTRDELGKLLIKQPLTINMLRNYLVHGQLFKNALVYRNNRVLADRVMEKPGVLYSLFLLLLIATLKRHPELLD